VAVEAGRTRPPGYAAFVDRTIDELGKIDIVLANARHDRLRPSLGDVLRAVDETIDVCLNGGVEHCRSVMPTWWSGKAGSIVITSSNAG